MPSRRTRIHVWVVVSDTEALRNTPDWAAQRFLFVLVHPWSNYFLDYWVQFWPTAQGPCRLWTRLPSRRKTQASRHLGGRWHLVLLVHIEISGRPYQLVFTSMIILQTFPCWGRSLRTHLSSRGIRSHPDISSQRAWIQSSVSNLFHQMISPPRPSAYKDLLLMSSKWQCLCYSRMDMSWQRTRIVNTSRC